MNITVAGLMVKKVAGIDMSSAFRPLDSGRQATWDNTVSPRVDAAGNFIWQIPVSGAMADPANWNAHGGPVTTPLSFVGNTAFDLNGTLSPLIAAAPDPDTRVFVYGMAAVLNAIYAFTAFAGYMVQYLTGAQQPAREPTPHSYRKKEVEAPGP